MVLGYIMNNTTSISEYKIFYNKINRETCYTVCNDPRKHSAYRHIKKFIRDYMLRNKKCLEIGSAKGIFQNMVENYTGLDVAESLAKYYQKPYLVVNKDGTYPFDDNSFEAIWSYEVHEHIPNINQDQTCLNHFL